MKRILYFLLTNIAIIAVISIILSVAQMFGLDLSGIHQNANMPNILIYSFIVGMSGAVISLFMSKWTVKRMMGVHVIDESEELHKLVTKIAQKADISKIEVGVYQADEVNAFATGWSKNNALVAFSTGLLQKMKEDELEGVIAHEIAHVKNGDMVTLALIQGVVNTFVVFGARVISNFIKEKNETLGEWSYFFINIGLQIVFGLLATPIVMFFSRKREFRADEGSAKLVGKQKMISALESLRKENSELPSELEAMGISGRSGWFASHPSIDERIANLKKR